MIAYILRTADKASMLTLLSGLGMTYIDDIGVEKWMTPNQCGFFSVTGITQQQ